MVSEESTDHVISWCQQGRAIIVKNRLKFSEDILPLYFKHNTYQSFVRQLNMYGFRKVKNADSCLEFSHPSFRQGQQHLLRNIKRKSSVAHYHAALHGMKKRQVDDATAYLRNITHKLKKMKQRQMFIELQVLLLKCKCDSLRSQNELLKSVLSRDTSQEQHTCFNSTFRQWVDKY